MVVWTDDLLMASPPNNASAAKIKIKLTNELKLSAWAPVDDMLGCVIKANAATRITTLSQEATTGATIESIFKRSGLSTGNPIMTPMQSDVPLTKTDCPEDEIAKLQMREQASRYRSLLASCIYLTRWTRPDTQPRPCPQQSAGPPTSLSLAHKRPQAQVRFQLNPATLRSIRLLRCLVRR